MGSDDTGPDDTGLENVALVARGARQTSARYGAGGATAGATATALLGRTSSDARTRWRAPAEFLRDVPLRLCLSDDLDASRFSSRDGLAPPGFTTSRHLHLPRRLATLGLGGRDEARSSALPPPRPTPANRAQRDESSTPRRSSSVGLNALSSSAKTTPLREPCSERSPASVMEMTCPELGAAETSRRSFVYVVSSTMVCVFDIGNGTAAASSDETRSTATATSTGVSFEGAAANCRSGYARPSTSSRASPVTGVGAVTATRTHSPQRIPTGPHLPGP